MLNTTFKKVLFPFLILLVILFLAILSVPYLFKDQLVAAVKKETNANLNAKVDFTDVDVTLFRSFPDLSLALQNLSVAGIDSFATDTLASIPSLHLDINIMSLIKGSNYQINAVKLKNPVIYARVLKSGKANWDIIKADSSSITDAPSDTSGFKAALSEYSIENGTITYHDASLGFYLLANSLNHSGKGDFTEELFTLKTQSDIEKLTVKYGGVTYLNDVKLSAGLPLHIDMKQMKFSLDENKIHLNELILSLVGSLALPNDQDMLVDVKFDAKESDFKNFLSLIPAIYSSSFKDLKASGKFSFKGTAKGVYNEKSLPAFNVALLIDNGKINYPGLPSAINNIAVKTFISNPDGVIDHTEINVPAFHLEFGSVPLDGRLLVKNPVSNPYVDMALKGKLDLKQLTTIFPMKDTKLSGNLDVDISAAGSKSTIDKGQYQNFKAAGFLIANNINYTGSSVPMPLNVPSVRVSFSPRNVTLSNLAAQLGKSDVQANGTLDNYLEYALNKNVKLKGNFNVQSNLMDLNSLMSNDTPREGSSADNAKLKVIEIPENIDFRMSLSAKRVLYDNYDISNAKGALHVKDQTIHFDNMALEMLDGKVRMNGWYTSKDIRKPKVDIDFGIEQMSIQKAFSTFNTVKLLAPVAKYTQGSFSTNLKFDSDLDANMMPLYSSLNATGLTNIIQAIVQGFEPLNKLSAALNTDKLKKLELNNVLAKFQIQNGKLNIPPFDIKKGKFLMNVQGTNGLDQSLQYQLAMNVPRELLGANTTEATNAFLARFNESTKSNLDIGETIKVNALISGTILKPNVKISLAETKAAAKDMVNNLVAEKKAELQAKAQLEANNLKDKAVTAAQQKADTVKKQVEAKAATEVRKQLNNLFKKKKTEEEVPAE